MIHIRNTAKEFVARLKKEGFNGVRYEQVVLEGSDLPEPGEETLDEKAEFDQNYAIFIAAPYWPGTYTEELPYTETIQDRDRYWRDFEAHLKTVFGDDVTITFYKGCYETEIHRAR